MAPLALAIEIAELVEAAQETDRGVDVREEAKRLVRRHPDAAVSEAAVAAAIKEEVLAARAETH